MCSRCYTRWKKYGSTDARYYTCPKNHPLSPDNVLIGPDGKRHCAACRVAKTVPLSCVIDDCDDPQVARGWCRKHYLRWYRLGDTATPPRFTVKTCSVEGCHAEAVKRGWCIRHHARWKRHGTTDDPPPRPTRCAVEGCGRPPKARGWCKPHHKKLTGQGTAHEMKRYALKLGSQVERVDYESILAEFGMTCHICRTPITTRDDLQYDHVIPLARGGPHIFENIRPSHAGCNRRKNARLMAEL